MKIRNPFVDLIRSIEQGDIIQIGDDYYLVCPYPKEFGKYYLPSLNGMSYYGDTPYTLEEINSMLDFNQVGYKIYNQDEWELEFIPRKKSI